MYFYQFNKLPFVAMQPFCSFGAIVFGLRSKRVSGGPHRLRSTILIEFSLVYLYQSRLLVNLHMLLYNLSGIKERAKSEAL